jgi:hypothetical protein
VKKLWWRLWKRPAYDPALWTIIPGVAAATCGVVSSLFFFTTAPLTWGSYLAGCLVLLAAVVVYQQVLKESIWWYGIRTGKVKPRPEPEPPASRQHRQLGITENEFNVELLDHRFGGHWGTDTTGPKVYYPTAEAAHDWATTLSTVYGPENVRVRSASIHYEEVSAERAPAND